jgi:hypothetical protein
VRHVELAQRDAALAHSFFAGWYSSGVGEVRGGPGVQTEQRARLA